MTTKPEHTLISLQLKCSLKVWGFFVLVYKKKCPVMRPLGLNSCVGNAGKGWRILCNPVDPTARYSSLKINL